MCEDHPGPVRRDLTLPTDPRYLERFFLAVPPMKPFLPVLATSVAALLATGMPASAADPAPPAVALEIATKSAHWHYTTFSDSFFEAVDVHGVSDGATEGLKRMSVATFYPAGQSMDFMVSDMEFDCEDPGRYRKAAVALYAVREGAVSQLGARSLPPDSWVSTSTGTVDFRAWDWACKGDKKIQALQAGARFEDMLEFYRNALKDAGS